MVRLSRSRDGWTSITKENTVAAPIEVHFFTLLPLKSISASRRRDTPLLSDQLPLTTNRPASSPVTPESAVVVLGSHAGLYQNRWLLELHRDGNIIHPVGRFDGNRRTGFGRSMVVDLLIVPRSKDDDPRAREIGRCRIKRGRYT